MRYAVGVIGHNVVIDCGTHEEALAYIERMEAAQPAAPAEGHSCGDPACPGQDGDPCHYEPQSDAPTVAGRDAMYPAEGLLEAEVERFLRDLGGDPTPTQQNARRDRLRKMLRLAQDVAAPAEGLDVERLAGALAIVYRGHYREYYSEDVMEDAAALQVFLAGEPTDD